MPKVSQDHRDARRRQILDGARRCFVRKGFHGTSMQDVLAEVGLSTGAVYRYFPSKDEIVVAIATEAIGQVYDAFAAAASSDPPPPIEDVVAEVLAVIDRLDDEFGMARLALAVWGEATRSPVIAEAFTAAYGDIREHYAVLVRAYNEAGRLDGPVDAVTKVLASILPGYILQRALMGDVDPEEFRAGLGALVGASQPSR